jgi:hypothetical protein
LTLFFFLMTIYAISVIAFWLPGLLFGLMLTPRVYFPLRLAAEMAAAMMLTMWFLGYLAVAVPVVWMNLRFSKRADYRQWPTILAGLAISMFALAVTYFAGFSLAWAFFE